MLVLSLSLDSLKPYQCALTFVIGGFELLDQLSLLLLDRPERLLHLAPEIRLNLEFIVGVSDAFFGHKDLLSDLHKTTKELHIENIYEWKREIS